MTNDNFSKLGKFLVKHRWAYFGFRYFGIYLIALWYVLRTNLPEFISELHTCLVPCDYLSRRVWRLGAARDAMRQLSQSLGSSPCP